MLQIDIRNGRIKVRGEHVDERSAERNLPYSWRDYHNLEQAS
jgi:hypothetical protein